jgi:MscS family membrane protein
MMMIKRHFTLLLFFLGMISISPAFAQGTPSLASALTGTTTTAAKPAQDHDPLGRETPRGMTTGFLNAIDKEDWTGAISFLDLNFMPKSQQKTRGEELAKQLQTLLNQGGWIMPGSMISDDPAGKPDDPENPQLEKIGILRTGSVTADLTAEQVRQPDGSAIWLISAQTLRKVPDMYEDIKPPRIDRLLPEVLKTDRVAGVPAGHWLAMGVIAVLAYLVAWGVTYILIQAAGITWRRLRKNNDHIFDALELPVRLYMAVWIFIYSCMFMGVSALARQHVGLVPVIVGWLSLILFIWRFIDIAADRSQRHMSKRGKLGMFSVIHFVRRSAKFLFLAIAFIVILGTFGVDVRTFIAALGVGGIALALGAQKTVENFVGSLMLIFDQPVRLGDYCKIGNTSGTVEDIGMRSTRLRTNDRTVVTIPNGEFSSLQIENYARRDRYLFNPTLGLRYETTPDQIRWLLVELRTILYAHPRVSNDPARVRLVKLDTNSINLEIFTYILTPGNDEFMEVQEDLYLRIMDKIEEAGTGFAFPSQTLYMGRDTGIGPDKAKDIGEQVRQWRDKGDLQLPAFTPEHIRDIQDTIQYPPPGSAQAKK